MKATLTLASCGLAIVAAALLSSAFADEPPKGQFGESIEVQEVLLDVVVTDRDGNVVLGLKPSDFRVSEDAGPVAVTSAAFYSNRRFLSSETAKRLGIDPATVPDQRYFILFFDDQKRNAGDITDLLARQLEAGRSSARWVRERLLPADWVAVVSYDVKLRVLSDFSRDPDEIVDAIGRAVRGGDSERAWPSRAPARDAARPSLLSALPSGNELRDRTGTIWDALQIVSRAGENIVGRKNLIYFGIGFGEVNAFGLYTPDPRYDPPTIEALDAANVAVYTIDLTETGAVHPFENALNRLSVATGGRLFKDIVSFATPLGEIEKENNGYYLLSYRREQPAGARAFQKVKVKLSNPEFRVIVREGYRLGGTDAPVKPARGR